MRRCRRCWGCSPGEAAAEHELCRAGAGAGGTGGVRPVRFVQSMNSAAPGAGAGGAGGVRPVRLLQSIDYAALAPVLVAAVGVVAVLVADVALPVRRRPLLL